MVGAEGLVYSSTLSDEVIEDGQQPPVVDLSHLRQNKSLVLDTVHQASKNWGIFQLLRHGIPAEYQQDMRDLVAKFVDLPADEKQTYLTEDKLKKFQFSFNSMQRHDYLLQLCCPAAPLEVLPDRSIPNYSEISTRYYKAVDGLARTLLGIFDECLGLEGGTLQRTAFDPPRHSMRMNYYPPCTNPESVVGLAAHSDPGAFTILHQDFGVEGLQVVHNGEWVTVKPVKDALVVSVADQLEIMSNGEYKSVEHRALTNTDKARISIASFYSPNMDAYIAPLPSLGPPKYKGCKFETYLPGFLQRFASSRDLEKSTTFIKDFKMETSEQESAFMSPELSIWQELFANAALCSGSKLERG